MSLAIASLSRLLAPLWLAPTSSQPVSLPVQPRFPVQVRPQPTTPLRVTRLSEEQLPRHLAGRMVICGRFDEFCRELERLEALGQDRTH
ncbi:MAG: hypothetical protein QM527_02210 [Alphaproteobacteria bacterium]|nr:hypothetical protein [Alphaproteobacteria bacterium]